MIMSFGVRAFVPALTSGKLFGYDSSLPKKRMTELWLPQQALYFVAHRLLGMGKIHLNV